MTTHIQTMRAEICELNNSVFILRMAAQTALLKEDIGENRKLYA